MADTSIPQLPLLPLPPLPQIDTTALDTMNASVKQIANAPVMAVNSLLDAANNATKSFIAATQQAANNILPQPGTPQVQAPVVNPLGQQVGTNNGVKIR